MFMEIFFWFWRFKFRFSNQPYSCGFNNGSPRLAAHGGARGLSGTAAVLCTAPALSALPHGYNFLV